MANLKNVVYMSNENYNTLITTGSVTIGGVTYQYDSDNVYVTPDTSVSTEANQGLSATEKTNAKTNIDLNNVDNTSDLNKPISTAVQTALNGKQDKLTTVKDTASTSITLTANGNTNYIYGELTALNLSFADGTDNAEIDIMFKSGATATTLTVSTTNAKFESFTPSANAYVGINAKWYIDKWIVLFNEVV